MVKKILSPEDNYYEEKEQMDDYEENVAQASPEIRSGNTSNVVPFQNPAE